MGTVLPGLIAFAVGAVLAITALVPWTAWEYRRHGQLGFRRSLVAFGTLVYALAIVTYTLLPLPDDVSTMCRNATSPQLDPLAFLSDIRKEGGISGPRALLTNPASAQVLFNVLLFVPFGALVRHVIARKRILLGLLAGLSAGFVASLLVELTQLTGDWFLYPCSYRLFDVDDLLANTVGAVFGTLLGPVVGIFAGSARSTEASMPRPVTESRRFTGFVVDVLAIWLVSGAISVGITAVWVASGRNDQDPSFTTLLAVGALVAPALQLVLVTSRGRTLGEVVVRLRPTPQPAIWKRVFRWLLGSGGWATLLVLDVPFGGSVAFVLAVASVIAVWVTRGHRGLALAALGLDLRDDRITDPNPAGRVARSQPL